MKIKKTLPIALATLALLASSASAAVEQQRVTLQFRATFEGELIERESSNSTTYIYTEEQKLQTAKFSNKELLEALVEEGVISSIGGWSLVALTQETGESMGFYLIKNGRAPVSLANYLSINDDAEEGSYVEAFKSTYQETATSAVETGSYTGKGLVDINITIGSGSISAVGMISDAGTWTFDQNSEAFRLKPGKAAITSVAGKFTGEDEEDENGEKYFAVIEGSVNVTPSLTVAFP